MEQPVARRRLGRQQWIREALRVLGDEGVDAVRVEPLAKRLGVTKGSFYHHFADREELLVAVLDAWCQQATLLVIELANRHSRRPEERLRCLLETVISPATSESLRLMDVGIREWARRDRRARSVLETIDSTRLHYIEDRLLALGCEPDEAEERAFLVYSHILGESLIAGNDAYSIRAHRLERCLARLVLDLPGVGAVEEAH